MAKSLAQRARANPKVLRRALRNPEKRAQLPERMVPRRFRPIVPGSDVTNKQLRRETRASAREKYGPLLRTQRQDVGEAKAARRDTGNYYDEYLRQVQQQSANVAQIGREAQTAVQGLQAGVTGLAGQDVGGVQQAASADAAARGATAGDVTQMGSNAAAVRQALVGSFAAQQAATNAAASTQASTRANVVAPGQKLGAMAMAQGGVRQAREKLGETRAAKGAYKVGYRQERKAEEAKTVLAKQALGLDVAKAKADVAQGKREVRADVKKAKIDAGVEREKARADAIKNSPGNQVALTEAKALANEAVDNGYSYEAWKAMTPAQRRKAMKTGGKGSTAEPKGRDWLTKGQSGAGLTQLTELKALTEKAKAGKLFKPGTGKPPPLGRYGGEKKVAEYAGSKLKHPALARAAADAVYDGHISAYTEKQLKAAGYKPRDVAAALGVPSHKGYMKTTTGKNTGAYARGRGGGPQGHL